MSRLLDETQDAYQEVLQKLQLQSEAHKKTSHELTEVLQQLAESQESHRKATCDLAEKTTAYENLAQEQAGKAAPETGDRITALQAQVAEVTQPASPRRFYVDSRFPPSSMRSFARNSSAFYSSATHSAVPSAEDEWNEAERRRRNMAVQTRSEDTTAASHASLQMSAEDTRSTQDEPIQQSGSKSQSEDEGKSLLNAIKKGFEFQN